MVEYLQTRRMRSDLAEHVNPRTPFRSRVIRPDEMRALVACVAEIDDLQAPLSEIDPSAEIPVLLRHYVRLGGRVAAFNIDRNFSNVLDGLLVVDLRETPQKLLSKYVGPPRLLHRPDDGSRHRHSNA
jgi:hypothetical protein